MAKEDLMNPWTRTTTNPGVTLLTPGSTDLEYVNATMFRITIDDTLKLTGPVIVDLSELEYMDSTALGLLISLYKELTGAGRQLVVVTNEYINNLLALVRLNSVFTIVDSVDSAEELLAKIS